MDLVLKKSIKTNHKGLRNHRKAWEIPGKYGKETTTDNYWEIPRHFSSFYLKSPKIEIIAIRKMILKALLKIL